MMKTKRKARRWLQVPGHTRFSEVSVTDWKVHKSAEDTSSPSFLTLNWIGVGYYSERGKVAHTHTHTYWSHAGTELHFPHLRMRPNAANLDNLKHDKEQDDRKTIREVRERVGGEAGAQDVNRKKNIERQGYDFTEGAEKWIFTRGLIE